MIHLQVMMQLVKTKQKQPELHDLELDDHMANQ